MFINHLNLQKVMFINHLNLQKVSKNNPEMLARMETCKKVCVFDSASALGLYNMSKPNVALSSSVNS